MDLEKQMAAKAAIGGIQETLPAKMAPTNSPFFLTV
jgi:hypothetical protein